MIGKNFVGQPHPSHNWWAPGFQFLMGLRGYARVLFDLDKVSIHTWMSDNDGSVDYNDYSEFKCFRPMGYRFIVAYRSLNQ